MNRPTIVSVRLIPISTFRNDRRCWPIGLAPGLDDPTASNEAWLSELQTSGTSRACSAFGPAAQFELWQRSDRRNPFEAQSGLAYQFIPAGFIDRAEDRRIRCAIVFDPRAPEEFQPNSTLGQAAEVCAVLFHFREDG